MQDGDKLPKRRISAEIQLSDGSSMMGTLFISPQGRLLDMLNDGRGFLPVETESGEVMFLRKDAIRRVTPLPETKRSADANGGAAGRDHHHLSSDPYELLGIAANATGEAIREAYRQRCRENHPDRLQALGLPKEYIDLATQRMAAINAAYDQLRELRQAR
jgi:DnaJ-domain-containing protein 1